MSSNTEHAWLGHRTRLRDKARTIGLESLRPYEVVELILYQSDLRADMEGLARALVEHFGSIGAVFSASQSELMAVPGMRRGAADWIMRTGMLTRHFTDAEHQKTTRIVRLTDLIRYIAPLWRDVPAPQTWMLYTDFQNRLLMRSLLCDSLAWADPAIARQILQDAMSINARRAFLICFTGPEPLALTDEERTYLHSLAVTLGVVGVDLLDCLLVGEAGFHSMNQAHEMEETRLVCNHPWLHERYLEEDEACTELPDS